jgi:pyridine nucleotide-disulfide oxidoreductase family protein
VKRLVLAGAGHAHLVVLRELTKSPLRGARITLVTPYARQIYSGMLPGFIAGHYRRDEVEIDVARLAERAYVEFVPGTIEGLHPDRRRLTLEDGTELAYDTVSLNVGSQVGGSIPGSKHHALAVKPFESFAEGLASSKAARIAIAGAGAAGAELAMALRYRGAVVTLYSDKPAMPRALERRARRVLRRMGVDFRLGMPVSEIVYGPQIVAGKSRQAFDLVLLATGAAAPSWLRASGLACDERGFLLVNDALQSISRPEVFAAGDCASLHGRNIPKSGVYSVRQGETLARSFRNLIIDKPLEAFRPQRRALLLLSCGRRCAIAEWGGWTLQSRLFWWLKDRIDRGWIASFR